MEEMTIRPRFSETDALGHISNTTLPVWFEAARTCIFERVHPALTFDDWPLIVARFEVDLKSQLFVGSDVTVRTGVEKIGNRSLTVYQEAWQKGVLAARGRTVFVYFDYGEQRSRRIPDAVRERLSDLLVKPGQGEST
jgi:acyl-CoA thioester hydrolase